jgi:serine phosphatase RsbU (regulator of sigma subunit)
VWDNGLEAAVCLVNRNDRLLTFAGAHLPLYVVHNGAVTMIKGHKVSIGYKRTDPHFTFTNQSVSLQEGMAFYLATDGFIDQAGGVRGFPFGGSRFTNLLQETSGQPFDRQQDILLQAFKTYKGDYEQRDDVTVVGFSISS